MLKGVALPRKVFESLLVPIYLSLKVNAEPIYGKKISAYGLITPEYYQRFENFMTVTKVALNSNNFRPGKCTGSKGAGLFNIRPVYRFQLAHGQFDARIFSPLLRKAGLLRGKKI
jgi:hypothetical protein